MVKPFTPANTLNGVARDQSLCMNGVTMHSWEMPDTADKLELIHPRSKKDSERRDSLHSEVDIRTKHCLNIVKSSWID
jgi:hypothetical protein